MKGAANSASVAVNLLMSSEWHGRCVAAEPVGMRHQCSRIFSWSLAAELVVQAQGQRRNVTADGGSHSLGPMTEIAISRVIITINPSPIVDGVTTVLHGGLAVLSWPTRPTELRKMVSSGIRSTVMNIASASLFG